MLTYVGKTQNEFSKRRGAHLRDANKLITNNLALFRIDDKKQQKYLRAVEEFFIETKDLDALTNKNHAVAEKPKSKRKNSVSKSLRKLVNKLDFCK